MTCEIIQPGTDGVVHARISGIMTHADQLGLEDKAKELMDDGRKVRVLITLEDFDGWDRDEAWGDDMQFQLEYANEIDRIAIVGEQRWKDPALMFVGKGFRDTDIEFFLPDALDAAKAWLTP